MPHPCQVSCRTLCVLGVHLWSASEVVVTAYYVERNEQHITVCPAHVLAELGVPGVFTLAGQSNGAPTEALVPLKKHLTNFCQSLKRIIRARLCPVTIGPVVVSRSEYKRMPGTLSQTQTILESLVTAGRKPAVLLCPRRAVPCKIAVMNDKGDISRINFLHYIGELLFVPCVIRHVADQREFKSAALSRLNGGAARKEND